MHTDVYRVPMQYVTKTVFPMFETNNSLGGKVFTLFAAFPHINIIPGFSDPIEIATVAPKYCVDCGITETPMYDGNNDEWIMPCHHFQCADCEYWFNINITPMEYDYAAQSYKCEDCYVPPVERDYDSDCDCIDCRRNRGDGYNRYITPMWERDGLELSSARQAKMRKVTQLISAEASMFNPQMSMATFYVADYIIARINMQYRYGLSPNNKGHRAAYELRADAKRVQDNIVANLDGVFRDYLLMACGGELRHYYGIKMPDGRSSSWEWFVAMANQHGREYMISAAAELFEDDRGWGGSYGGAKWAIIARTLELRESGKIDSRTFVDRVFSLQHNGGSALNKVTWNGRNEGTYYCERIGNAHAATITDFPTLFRYMSPEIARELLFDANGAVRMSTAGMSPAELTNWNTGISTVASALGFEWATLPKCSGTWNFYGDYVSHEGKVCAIHPDGDGYHYKDDSDAVGMEWFKS